MRVSDFGRVLLGLCLFPICACVDDMTPQVDQTTPSASTITITSNAGVWSATVDATDATSWQLLDLDAAAGVTTDRSGNSVWDLGLQRFAVRTNSGVSGPATVQVARLTDTPFDGLTHAPTSGWLQDAGDGTDEDDKDDLAIAALGDWYTYDAATHKLSPAAAVFAVRTSAGHYKKVEFQSYYDDAGTSGWVRLRWADLQPPGSTEAPKGLAVDASSKTDWAFVRLSDQKVVVGTDAGGLSDWDVAVQRTLWRTAGAEVGGVAGALELADAKAVAVDTVGFAADAPQAPAGPPGGTPVLANPILSAWYNYDALTHAVSPKPVAYAVRSRSGHYFRLQITSWNDGKYLLDIAKLRCVPAEHTVAVDATSKTTWTYLDLAAGAVTLAPQATPTAWDLAAQRTLWRSNGGSSGTGAGAVLLANGDFAAVLSVPDSGYTVDTEMPLAGPPGSGTTSQNPVLSAWYDYDPTTHAVTAKPVVYLIRTADGGAAKVAFTAYASGAYTLRYVLAGPGRATFAADVQ
jgi:hypothetical protein